jgi:LPXTG-motif cell wall-anchored protein
LSGSAVTNTGSSVITGDVGVVPNTALTGFPPGMVIGTKHVADTLAGQAQIATTNAYDALDQTCTTTFTPPTDLSGKTLVPGVYCFGSTAALTGVLTLDGQNNPSAVWVFKIGSALNAGSGSSIVFIRSGSGCNVFWRVTSSATIGTTSHFAGNIIALTSITLNHGAQLSSGRALARNGAVTLDTNNVSAAPCSASVGATATAVSAATATATAGVAATATAGVAATATAVTAATETAVAGAPPTGCVGNIRGQKVDGAGHGLAGWTIQLLQGGQVVQTAVTDASGAFNFLGLGMGAYVIQEVPQNGWVAQSPSSINVTLGSCGQNLTGNTFVNAAASSGGSAALTATAIAASSGGPAALTATAAAASSGGSAALTATAVAASSGGSAALTATAAARSAAAATAAAKSVVPKGLPSTGDSPPWSGLFGLLFGALLVLMGVGIARRSHR